MKKQNTYKYLIIEFYNTVYCMQFKTAHTRAYLRGIAAGIIDDKEKNGLIYTATTYSNDITDYKKITDMIML